MALCWAERALSGDWWKQRPDYTVRKSIGGEAMQSGLLRKLAAQVSCGQDLGRREREGVMSGAKEKPGIPGEERVSPKSSEGQERSIGGGQGGVLSPEPSTARIRPGPGAS